MLSLLLSYYLLKRIENISGTFRHLKNGFRESNVKFGEEDKIKEFQTKKIWVVVTNFKLYLFKRLKIKLLSLKL